MSKVASLQSTLTTAYDAVVTTIQTLSDDTSSLAFVNPRFLDYEIKRRSENGETSGKLLQTDIKQTNKNPKQNEETKEKIENLFTKLQRPYNKTTGEFNPSKYQNLKGRPYTKYKIKKYKHFGRKNHEKKNSYSHEKTFQTQ